MTPVCAQGGTCSDSQTPDLFDREISLEEAVAQILGLSPGKVTPADIQRYREEHIYPNADWDLRTQYGGMVTHCKRCLTQRDVEKLRKDTEEFMSRFRR